MTIHAARVTSTPRAPSNSMLPSTPRAIEERVGTGDRIFKAIVVGGAWTSVAILGLILLCCAVPMFVALTAIEARITHGGPAASDRTATVLVSASAGAAVAALIAILWFVVSKGLVGLTGAFFTETLEALGPLDPATVGGAEHAIIGTPQQVGIATLIATPLGILTAVYLSEFPGRLTRVVRVPGRLHERGPVDRGRAPVVDLHLDVAKPEGGSHESPRIQLEALEVAAWFGKKQILEGISLAMPANSVTAIIGPSGCGKSTFLRVLNRMHELVSGAAMAGEVLLDGVDVYGKGHQPAETRRRIGMVFQKPNPFPTMSIRENVLSGLVLNGTKWRGQDDLVEHSLAQAGLWNEVKDRLGDAGGSLSGGQQQRLCIARALAVSPSVLLMDEPCSALDPSSTRRIEETIREIVSEVTVVIVTHNMQQAARNSDRTAFFLGDEGRPGGIVEYGPTPELFNTPNDPRTEDYILGRFG